MAHIHMLYRPTSHSRSCRSEVAAMPLLALLDSTHNTSSAQARKQREERERAVIAAITEHQAEAQVKHSLQTQGRRVKHPMKVLQV